MPPPRMSMTTRLVLAAFLVDPDCARYGLELCRTAGLASGTIHPILARLETAEWLTSHWEDIDPAVAGRPARRYYQLTEDGLANALRALAERPVALPASRGQAGARRIPAATPARPWTPTPGVSPA